jgi:hypothetical protein
MLGHLLVKALPFVDSLWLVNFISALFGAASVMLLFLLVHGFTNSLFAALYACLALGVSHTFWWHSSTPEVYTLFVFLLLAGFLFFDRFETTNRHLFLGVSAFFLGLSASTHVLAFLALPALGLYFFLCKDPRDFKTIALKKLSQPAIGFLAGFSLYLIQFVRMSANFSLREIMGPVVGSTFLSRLGTFSPEILMQSGLSYLFFLTVQFGPVGIALGVLGARRAFEQEDPSLRKIAAFFAVFALFGIFYRVTDQFTFFIASYIFWAMLLGCGAYDALTRFTEKGRFLLAALLGFLLCVTPFFYTGLPGLAARAGIDDAAIGIPKIGVGVRNGLAYYINPNKRGDDGAYRFGRQVISNLAPNSMVLAEWYTDTDEFFILRYFTRVDRVRPDVSVIGWPTEDPFSFDSRLALDRIETSFPDRPVYLASLSDRFYAGAQLIEMYCIVPEHHLYRLYPKQDQARPCLGIDAVTE